VAEKGVIDLPLAAVDLSTSGDTGAVAVQIVQRDTINDNLYASEPLPRKPGITQRPARSPTTTARST
jgi:hypothetical protein